jgi:hypothetical protein
MRRKNVGEGMLVLESLASRTAPSVEKKQVAEERMGSDELHKQTLSPQLLH